MKLVRVNKYVLIFLAVITLAYIGLAPFVQSEMFGNFASREIDKRFLSQSNVKFSFRNVKVSLFPPKTKLHDVVLDIKEDNTYIHFEASGVTASFSLWSFLGSEMNIDNVQVMDGSVLVSSEDKEDIEEEVRPVSREEVADILGDAISKAHSFLPISITSLAVKNIEIGLKNSSAFVKDADLVLYENYLVSHFYLENVVADNIDGGAIEIIQDIDSISGVLELSRNDLAVRNLEINKKLERLSLNANYRFNEDMVSADLQYYGLLENHSPYLEVLINEWFAGAFTLKASLFGPIENLQGHGDIDIVDFKSNFALVDELSLGLRLSNDVLHLNHLSAKKGSGNGKLLRPVALYNTKSKKTLFNDQFEVDLNGIFTNDALYIIREDLNIVKGYLSGKARIEIDLENKIETFFLDQGFEVRDFKLVDNDFLILSNPKLELGGSKITLGHNGRVDIFADIEFGEKSHLQIGGAIDSEGVDFKTTSAIIDMVEFGQIAGVSLEGYGPWSMEIRGPFDDVRFYFTNELDYFGVLGFVLDRALGELSYQLNQSELKITSLIGNYGDASFLGSGTLNFSSKDFFDLVFEVDQLSYKDAEQAIAPLYKLLPYHPEDLDMAMDVDVKVWGGFDKDIINAKGDLKTGRIQYKVESFDNLSLSFEYIDEYLKLENIRLLKGEGGLSGRMSSNFKNNFIEYDGSWSGTQLSQSNFYGLFNLGLDADVKVDFYGSGTPQELSTKTNLILENARIESTIIPNTNITLYNNTGDFFLEGTFFGMFDVDAYLNLDEKNKQKLSYVNFDFKIEDIRQPLGFLAKRNISDPNLEGKLKGAIKTDFAWGDIKTFNLDLRIDDFNFSKNRHNLFLKDRTRLKIEKGVFANKEIIIQGSGGNKIAIDLEGSLYDSFTVKNKFMVSATLAEIVTDVVKISTGQLEGELIANGNLDKISTRSLVFGKSIDLQIDGVPGIIEGMQFELTSLDQSLAINSLNGKYGKGDIKASGHINLLLPFPSFEVDVFVDNSYLPILNRSGLVLSGGAILRGDAPPYNLSGDINILFGEILEEISDFQTQGDSLASYERFMPQTEQARPHLLNLNLNVQIQRPISARNNMLDLLLDGGGQIRGPIYSPQVDATISTTPGSSKFKFKGHEFHLTRGLINIDRTLQRDGAKLDFSGVSTINDYRIRLDVTGQTKNVSVTLSSEPSLSQDDIFSLLTLGVTSDISQGLDEGERQNVATIGIGTLLADQFRLNEGLDSSFGVKLSVLPEYAEEESNLLQGKSAVSEAGSSKIKSATRIRLEKKVNERIDLSVSSTVGGSLEQRQEMNVNFKINNRWSLEGVYEMRSGEDEGVEANDSVGADLKYRWSF